MGDPRPVLRPSDIRQAVTEWAAKGFSVSVDTRAGIITVTPPGAADNGDAFDQVDMRR